MHGAGIIEVVAGALVLNRRTTRFGNRIIGGRPAQHKLDLVARRDLELSNRPKIFAAQRNVSGEQQPVGSGDDLAPSVVATRYPRQH